MENMKLPQKFETYHWKLGTVYVSVFDFKELKTLDDFVADQHKVFNKEGVLDFYDKCLLRIETSKSLDQYEFRFSKLIDGSSFVSNEWFQISNPHNERQLIEQWEQILQLFTSRVEYEKGNKCPKCDENLTHYSDASGVCYCKTCKIRIFKGEVVSAEEHGKIRKQNLDFQSFIKSVS